MITESHSLQMDYREYRPSGYTDDLGIIADRNQWIPARAAGWHVMGDISIPDEVIEWLDENNILYLHPQRNRLVILYYDDATLFKMRWL